MMKSFTFPIQWRACLFALLDLFPRLLYSLRYVVGCACAVSIGIDIRFAHCRRLAPPVRWLLVICVCFPSVSYASSPPANDVHICKVLDYEDMRARDSLYVATKQALNLDVGEPRTVRMIYFLPNDRPFQQEVVDSMKVRIRQIQTFYADQMEAHGYGRKTFRFETDAQGDPVVHRVNGRHPDSYYIDNGGYGYWDEIREKFDTRANNVYVTVWDNSVGHINGAAGIGAGGRDRGGVTVTARFHWTTVAHELGHAFGLSHDFRNGNYIMSYGPITIEDQLSACHAEFLSVHPYFDPDIPDEETPGPTIELISLPGYPTGSTSVTIHLKVSDPDGLHQVLLFVNSRGGFAGGASEVKACRGLSGEKDAVVQFDYDGVTPSDSISINSDKRISSLSDPLVHRIRVETVDSFGNVDYKLFSLFDISTQRNVITALERHTDWVWFMPVAFSPDGTTLASRGTWDNTVKLWDVRTRTAIATLEGHTDRVNSVTFSPDGKMLASGSDDLTVKLWDVSKKTTIATLEGHVSNNSWRDRDGVNSVAFSPDGKMLASGSHDLTVKLWDVSKRTTIATLEGHVYNVNGGVNSVAFSPDGKILASGAYDRTVKLWDIATGQNIATLGHRINSYVYSVAFSPDGATLASGTGGGVGLWDVATGRNIATLLGTGSSYSVAFSPGGLTLASGSEDATIELWDVVTRTNSATLREHTGAIRSVAFSPDGTILASGSSDDGSRSSDNGAILLWNTSEWVRPRPAVLLKVSGDNQQGTSGAELTSPLVVELRDQYGSALPLKDVPVTFTVTTGNGRLNDRFTVFHVMSDANGKAQITLTLGPNSGANTVEVSLSRIGPGLKSLTFNAVGIGTPEVPITSGDYQTWHLPEGAMARLGKGKIGDSERAIAFSPDGQYLAVASGIGIWLYDVATYRELALIPGHITFVAFSPDGTLLVLGRDGGSVELWDVSTRTNIATLGNWNVTSVAFSPDGTLLALGIYGGSIELWDVSTRTNIATLKGHTDRVNSVTFSPDGTTLALGSGGGSIELWDVSTRTNIATLKGHTDGVNSVTFSPDGTLLASGGRDNTVKLWDVATRRNVVTLEGQGVSQVKSVVFSPDGTTLASGSWRRVTLWDIATRRNIATLEKHVNQVQSVVFSPDGTILASGSGGRVELWDVAKQNITTLEKHVSQVESVVFSPDGTTLASGSWGRVKLWDVATRRNIATLEGDTGQVESVVFSPDGTTLASGGTWDNTVKLWDVATRTNIATLKGHTNSVLSVAFSPDGTTLASGSFDNTVKLWDVATRTNITTFEGHTYRVQSVSFSPDGTTLASGDGEWGQDGIVKLWDVATWTNITTLKGHTNRVNSVVFSPDGKMLASGSADRTVKLWDVATWTNIATLEGYPVDLSFSPDGTILASGGHGIKLWDVATRTKIATLEGHASTVFSVSFSPDGTILASGSNDGTVLLWDMEKLTQPQPQTLVKVSGDKQEGVPSAPLANPLIVEVKDQNGNVLEGVAVTFSVTEGEGTLSVKTAMTDSRGHAQTVLTLGNSLGTTIVAVTVAGIEQPATFVIKVIATPDFDGDGTVGFPDFLLFVEQFGFSREDEAYQARFDLDGDGMIGFSDFLIFVNSFGKRVS